MGEGVGKQGAVACDSTEWMGEMLGRRPIFKGATRLRRKKIFLASRMGLEMGTNWTTSIRSQVSVQECCVRGMKSPKSNISVVNLELRMHFIARMQRAENKMSRDVSDMGPGGPSRKGSQPGGTRVRTGDHENTEGQGGPDGPIPGKFSDAGCPPRKTFSRVNPEKGLKEKFSGVSAIPGRPRARVRAPEGGRKSGNPERLVPEEVSDAAYHFPRVNPHEPVGEKFSGGNGAPAGALAEEVGAHEGGREHGNLMLFEKRWEHNHCMDLRPRLSLGNQRVKGIECLTAGCGLGGTRMARGE